MLPYPPCFRPHPVDPRIVAAELQPRCLPASAASGFRRWGSVFAAPLLTLFAGTGCAQTFTCGDSPAKAGASPLGKDSVYGTQRGDTFGFDLGTMPAFIGNHACTGDKPFFFSVAAKDGNYRVTLTLGSDTSVSTTTVRAEARRLMVDQLKLPPRGFKTISFIVNVRTPQVVPREGGIGPAEHTNVHLKPREIGALDWDSKLTLEFNGDHPSLRSLSIEPVANVPTVYLAGDSTVVDQDKEPWAAWGQMLPVFFGPGISIANEAESGETIKSFVSEQRLAKIASTIQPGDFLLIQFAHNDQKPGAGFVPAQTEYKDLLRKYIAEARSHGATPILVTSMNRRRFEAGKIVPTLGEYPQATRDIATEQHTALLDLNAMSKTLFEAMGEEGTLHAFVHYPANTYPAQPEELKDDTHFNSYGAYELARALIQSIRDQHLPLAPFLRDNIPAFNPSHPDPLVSFTLPPSPQASAATPYGR